MRRIVEARRQGGAVEGDPGVLAASGMIAGEGLAGVAIAMAVAARTKWPESGYSSLLNSVHFAQDDFTWLSGPPATLLGIAIVVAVSALLYRSAMSAPKKED